VAKKSSTYTEVITSLRAKKFAPIYLLMGEEPYYIDLISEYIEANVLTEDEQMMNQIVRYGKDSDISSIINEARRFPMMANYQVIIIKEAQMLDKIDQLEMYLQKPLETTILVVNYKYKSADKRKKWVTLAEQHGVVFESTKLRDYQMPPMIEQMVKEKGMQINEKAKAMLTDFVGTDLSQMAGVIEKLRIILPKDNNQITPEIIELNIGISKDFNAFELTNALIRRDVLMANRIVRYFAQNEKEHPIQATLAVLYNFFANLMCFHFLPNQQDDIVAKELKINTFFVKDYKFAAKAYNKTQVFKIIGLLREYDAKSKGIKNSSASGGELLKELVYKIMH
jgi:DNA polymerase III subunit delta